jgi:hypothetical protein
MFKNPPNTHLPQLFMVLISDLAEIPGLSISEKGLLRLVCKLDWVNTQTTAGVH